MSMDEINLTNTPYDDVFLTLLNDCSSLVIPLINELFQEHYSGKETIVFSPNEHFLNRQDGNEDKRITDSSFTILGKEPKKYHLECQSGTDNSMLVRFFEYDTQIALDEGELKGNTLAVTFPHSAVLFLRCNASTPDTLMLKMVTPGGIMEYNIPVMKIPQYTLKKIFEKKLLMLIPFYIFSHEKRFKRRCPKISLKIYVPTFLHFKSLLAILPPEQKINREASAPVADKRCKGRFIDEKLKIWKSFQYYKKTPYGLPRKIPRFTFKP